MSSMRNANQRRNHRERGQPLEREARLGILEKHKDYALRSKNHNENKKKLRLLRQKASERNPDEFSYGMLSSQSRKGRKLAGRQNPVLDQGVVKLLKTQDAGYVTTMLQRTKRLQASLEQDFVLNNGKGVELLSAISSQKKGNHTIFVDNSEQQRQYLSKDEAASRRDCTSRLDNPSRDIEKYNSDGVPFVCLPQTPPVARHADGRDKIASEQDKYLRKYRKKEQNARKSKLAAINARAKDLVQAKNELDLQRAKMGSNVGGTTSVGVKWKVRERKK